MTGNGRVFGPWRTIVGIAPTVRMQPPFNQPDLDDTGFYLPYYSTVFGPASAAPITQQTPTVVVRPRAIQYLAVVDRAGLAHPLVPELQHAVNQIDPNLPLYSVGTPRENQDAVLAQFRNIRVMFSVFGAVAVVLASVGLYGVMSFSVNQRTHEFGIRMALGAGRWLILRMVLRQAASQLGLGLALGVGAAVAISLIGADDLASALFNTNPRDPLTYGAVCALLAVVALLAALVPARRATRVDPMIALRAE